LIDHCIKKEFEIKIISQCIKENKREAYPEGNQGEIDIFFLLFTLKF
jgi:hypothetical protein